MSKIQFAGKTPKCVVCNSFFSLKKMDEKQQAKAHETGCCAKCQPAAEIVPQQVEVVKPGKFVRDSFAQLIANGKVNETMLNSLQSAEFTKATFGIRFAFLKAVDANVELKEQTMVNGKARYSMKAIEIAGKQYLMTNDIFKQTATKFEAWMNG